MRDISHFVNGATFTGSSGRFGDVFNPNTGEVQARVQLATPGTTGRIFGLWTDRLRMIPRRQQGDRHA